MPTPPPRRAWGTRFDSLVDTQHDMRPRDADPDLAAEKERSGDHDRAYLRSSSTTAPPSSDVSPLPVRMPHDASVFVASLPSHIPDPELQVHLSAHLCQHATIKHIKLIRDNRGAVCAFVQVESPAQAANLIAACNLSLFMDRHIRCEVARAFRTLLVSWRPPGTPLGCGSSATGEEAAGKPLRLRRCKGSRYIQVTHGSDALPGDLAHLQNYSPPRAEDPLSGCGIFFPSGIVEGDYEALKGLLEAFGPLEFITPFESTPSPADRNENVFVRGNLAVKQDANDTSLTEDVPRTPMWAAKWEHRNDAVSAITALQHVPRLFICWSHTYGRPYQLPYTPRTYSENQSRGSSAVHTPSYLPTPFQADPHSHTVVEVDPCDSEAQWAITRPRSQQLHAQPLAIDGVKAQEPLTFSESDFPPLRLEGDGHMVGARARGKRSAWAGRKNFVRAGAPSPPPISTSISTISRMYDGADTPTSGVPHTPDLVPVVEPSPVTPAFPMTPRTPTSGYVPGDEAQKDAAYGPSPCAPFPPRRIEDGPCDGRELFIGGLDAATWDEERIHEVFGRFGTLEEIRFVRPGFHAPPFKRAFAFIRFADPEASQKAIAEEHLRIYDDRMIKVQLREATGRRWAYRGRSRFQHGLLRTDRASFDFDHESSGVEPPGSGHLARPTGHVRFASAPDVASMNVETQPNRASVQTDSTNTTGGVTETIPAIKTEDADGDRIHGSDQVTPVTSSSSVGSDGAPDASMEAQPSSADTTITLADVTATHTEQTADSAQQEQSEQDTFTAVSSTPPPSNLDAPSTYAPSSEGSAPTSTGYYPTTPSWIPPYAIPPVPYGAYGYYPQQVSGQSGTETPTTYPWMATLYRNIVPFVPWFNPPPGVELAAPPVRPTGYIQRDPGGIFIPVYPPERLGQYMSTSGTTVDQSQSQGQASSAPSGNWPNIQPHPQLYPIPFPMQQTMMMQPQAGQQQQQLSMTGNGWITGPSPGVGYPSQQGALPSALPPYPTPNAYYQNPSSTATLHSRQNIYGPYDPALPHTHKHPNRRGEYGYRFGPREGRTSQRRGPGGPGVNAGDQSCGAGTVDPQFSYAMKPNGAPPAQLATAPSGSHGSEWNWNTQNR